MEHESEAAGAAAAPGLLRHSYPYLRTLLQLAVAGGLLAGLLLRVDRSAVWEQLQEASLIWLPLAFAGTIVSQWFRAIRWRYLLQPMRWMGVPFLFASNLIGASGNIVLPLRAGELIRVQVLRKRSGLTVSSIVATVLSEKLADMVAFSTFIVLGLLLFDEARFLWPLAVVYGGVVIGGLAAGRHLARRAEKLAELEEAPKGARLRRWLRRELHSFGHGLRSFLKPGAMFHIVWSSHAAWLCEATMYYAFGQAMGLDLSPAVYLLVVVTATIAVSVPLTQAGLGVFELAIAGLLVAFGVDEATAAAYAIFSHLFLAIPYLVSGPMAALALRLNPSDILFMRVGNKVEEEAPVTGEAAARPGSDR